MLSIHPQYVVNADRKRTAVLISAAEWEKVLEALEELDDILEKEVKSLAYDAGLRTRISGNTMPLRQVRRKLFRLPRQCAKLSRRTGRDLLGHDPSFSAEAACQAGESNAQPHCFGNICLGRQSQTVRL